MPSRKRGEVDQVQGPVNLAARLSAGHLDRIANQVMGPARQQRVDKIDNVDSRLIIDEVVNNAMIEYESMANPMPQQNVPAPPVQGMPGPSLSPDELPSDLLRNI
jgi:hypothetical protein